MDVTPIVNISHSRTIIRTIQDILTLVKRLQNIFPDFFNFIYIYLHLFTAIM